MRGPSRQKRRNLVGSILLGALLYAAFFTGGQGLQNKKRTTTRLLMGTLVSITTWGVEEEQERQGVAAAFAEMARIDALMSRHQPQSPVAQINAAPVGSPFSVSPELVGLLREAWKIQTLSQGAFDPGLGQLIERWGFSGDKPPTLPPTKAAMATWLATFQPGEGIVLEEGSAGEESRIYLTNPATGLDLGGIAKGYAIDRAIFKLKEFGITNALVNAGGDLRGIGHKGEAPWRVGIQHPREKARLVAESQWPNRPDTDVAMVTSGDYERFFIHDNKRYHHILDPKSGYPAQTGLLSVSVQANSATEADGWSTAFFVLGEKQSRKLLPKLTGVEVLFVRQDGSHWKSVNFLGKWLGKP
ncbi:MAG: FAD:protein FMN transferase [Magnetococcales bacterium]|nr:FAD:protein FMN transferase [Magnetococcales bacterium]